MRNAVQLIVVLALWAAPVHAWAIEGFSGSIWGIGIYESNDRNPQTLGSIRQGIDWFKVYDAKFSTYGKFRYRFENETGEFFNAYGPALGISLKKGGIRLGLEHQWDRYPNLEETRTQTDLYLEWWFGWDLKNLKK